MDDLILKLREYQYENRLTVADLAKLLDSNAHYLSTIFHKKRNAGPALQYRIRKLLQSNVDVDNRKNDKTEQRTNNANVEDDEASEICILAKQRAKLFPKISHRQPLVKVQNKV